tara:strand:- start:4784 stop:4912 length:129 start_codon:yes stop_codon:yes gene_type:complete
MDEKQLATTEETFKRFEGAHSGADIFSPRQLDKITLKSSLHV